MRHKQLESVARRLRIYRDLYGPPHIEPITDAEKRIAAVLSAPVRTDDDYRALLRDEDNPREGQDT